MKKYIILFILLFASTAIAGSDVNFQWDANIESDLAGYRLYRGTSSGGPYVMVLEIAEQDTTCTDPKVADGTYFWVLTAYDDDGLESGYSTEETTTLDSSAPDPPGGFTIYEITISGNMTLDSDYNGTSLSLNKMIIRPSVGDSVIDLSAANYLSVLAPPWVEVIGADANKKVTRFNGAAGL